MSRRDDNLSAIKSMSEDELLLVFREGVASIQEEYGLKVDRWCGPKTLALISELAAETDAEPEPGGLGQSPSGLAEIKRVFGEFEYQDDPDQPGAILIEKAWRYANVVEVVLHNGRRVWLHKKIAEEFKRVFERACAESGYTPERIGSFVPRKKLWRADGDLSTHAFAIAVDFDPKHNGYGKKIEDTAIGRNIKFAEVFEEAGWVWGGRWRTPDPMHFQRARRY